MRIRVPYVSCQARSKIHLVEIINYLREGEPGLIIIVATLAPHRPPSSVSGTCFTCRLTSVNQDSRRTR